MKPELEHNMNKELVEKNLPHPPAWPKPLRRGESPARQWLATCAARRPLPQGERGFRALGHEGADGCLMGGLKCGMLHEVYAANSGDEFAATGFVLALAI